MASAAEPATVDQAPGQETEQYYKALVTAAEQAKETDGSGTLMPVQTIRVKLLTGPQAGQEIEMSQYFEMTPTKEQLVDVGDRVAVVRSWVGGQQEYFVADRYRLPSLYWLAALFLVLTVAVGRWRGLTSVAGLAVSVMVIVFVIVPAVLHGYSPLTVGLISSLLIALVSIFMSHGLSRRTTVALASSLVILALAVGLALLFSSLAKITGLGSDEAFYIKIGISDIDLKGLFLAGVLLGTLGILDDVTVAQAATVEELYRANSALSFGELYRRGLTVGREHVASMVNTLALAYFGAGLPLFLVFYSDQTKPFWFIVNSELIAEEIIRTMVGSAVLVLAVPLATVMAAYVFSRWGLGRRGSAAGVSG